MTNATYFNKGANILQLNDKQVFLLLIQKPRHLNLKQINCKSIYSLQHVSKIKRMFQQQIRSLFYLVLDEESDNSTGSH